MDIDKAHEALEALRPTVFLGVRSTTAGELIREAPMPVAADELDRFLAEFSALVGKWSTAPLRPGEPMVWLTAKSATAGGPVREAPLSVADDDVKAFMADFFALAQRWLNRAAFVSGQKLREARDDTERR